MNPSFLKAMIVYCRHFRLFRKAIFSDSKSFFSQSIPGRKIDSIIYIQKDTGKGGFLLYDQNTLAHKFALNDLTRFDLLRSYYWHEPTAPIKWRRGVPVAWPYELP